jgi:hypothetical protein
VRHAAGQRHHVARGGREPADGTVGPVPDVEGELALGHVVDLAGFVAVHDRRAPAGAHEDLDGEQGAAGLGRRGEDRHLVGSQEYAFARGAIDR